MRRRKPDIWPWPRAVLDLDFGAGRYWWAGRLRQTSEFSTFALNGSTLDQYGLTPSGTVDITIALAGVGTVVPGSFAAVVYPTAVPGTARQAFAIDDGTASETIRLIQSTNGALTTNVVDGGVAQTNISIGTGPINVPNAAAATCQTNSVLAVRNGIASAEDTSAAMPAVTTLRLGKGIAAGTEFVGAIGRVILFSYALTQGELNEMTCHLRGPYF